VLHRGTEFFDLKARRDRFHLENLWLKQVIPRTRTKVPIGVERNLTVNMLPRARKISGTRRTMSHGRSERRIARTLTVEVCPQDEARLNERTMTENVSAHGARVLMEQKLQPGQRVLVSSPKEGVRSQARIIYCQRVSERRFAVGLELSGRVELWAEPY
jgi:hypothetical protein